jgi:hypothetical protein
LGGYFNVSRGRKLGDDQFINLLGIIADYCNVMITSSQNSYFVHMYINRFND